MTTSTIPTIALREARPQDREFLLAVYASTRADELAPLPWDDAHKAAFVDMQFTAQDRHWREQFSGTSFDVVLLDEQPAGRLYVDRRADEIRVVDITLLPGRRGAGIGTALLTAVIEEGARAGLPVRLHVAEGNRARALYERLGFVQISTSGAHHLLEHTPDQSASPR